MTMTKRLIVICTLLMIVLAAVGANAQDDTIPPWQAANAIREAGLEAQRDLFAARRADDPAANRQAAAEQIALGYDQFTRDLAPGLDADTTAKIEMIFSDAADAASTGNDPALAAALGRLWTEILNGAYQAAVTAVGQDDTEAASEWLRLREYRQATKATLILDPAADAITALANGDILKETAAAEIHNDLRDTYFFRLREALNDLESAVAKGYPTRAAEWAGQANGYFDIVQADFTAKLGEEAAQTAANALAALQTDAINGDLTTFAETLATARAALRDYQPVILTPQAIADKAQLLYVFLDLIPTEYRKGVRAGEITNAVEYNEALTFRDQAAASVDELRTQLDATDPTAADQLDTLLADTAALMAAHEDQALIREKMDAAKKLLQQALPVDTKTSAAATFSVIDTLLTQMEGFAANGQYADAEQTRLQAYALYDFGPEKLLLAFAPDAAARIEGLFWHGYDGEVGLAEAISQQDSADAIHAIRISLNSTLDDARVLIGEGSSEPVTIITNAAIIIFREGLEAVVIIAALTASMVGTNKRFRRPLFAGAVLAFAAAGITWLAADALLELLQGFGERLEAVVSIIAIGVLLVITNWFFHKMYWKDHLAGFHERKSRLLRGTEIGQILGLVMLGFTSIYREGFESVLFLQALVLDSGAATVLEGVALGLVGVALVGFITFRLQTRLPYMRLMVVTGILIGAVLLIMVGNTVHVMQVVGWLPITSIQGIHIPFWMGQWFGVFPTWQGITAQAMAAVFVIGSYLLVEYRNHRKRAARQSATVQAASS